MRPEEMPPIEGHNVQLDQTEFERTLWLNQLQPNDMVTRMVAGEMVHVLKVTTVTDAYIICNGWTFEKKNGCEIDNDIPTHIKGIYLSFIRPFRKEDLNDTQS